MFWRGRRAVFENSDLSRQGFSDQLGRVARRNELNRGECSFEVVDDSPLPSWVQVKVQFVNVRVRRSDAAASGSLRGAV